MKMSPEDFATSYQVSDIGAIKFNKIAGDLFSNAK